MKNSSADQLRWITPSEICKILHILRKPNSKFWFIQSNSKLKNKLKQAYLGRCKVHIDSASLRGSLGDEGLFRSANILQIADHRIKMFSNISSLILFHIAALSVIGLLIGHFRVPKTLTFKMRPSAQSFLWEWVLFAMKSHFHIKGWALNLVLIQRPRGTRKWPNVFSFVLAGSDWDSVFWRQIWLVPILLAALKPKQTYCGWAKNEPVVYSWLAVLNKLYFEIFKNLSTFFWCSCSAY